jgi:hypothetical protein
MAFIVLFHNHPDIAVGPRTYGPFPTAGAAWEWLTQAADDYRLEKDIGSYSCSEVLEILPTLNPQDEPKRECTMTFVVPKAAHHEGDLGALADTINEVFFDVDVKAIDFNPRLTDQESIEFNSGFGGRP